MSNRRSIETASGRIAYVEKGRGPTALFVHGVFLNADLWDGVIDGVSDVRRCLAPDILCHGHDGERRRGRVVRRPGARCWSSSSTPSTSLRRTWSRTTAAAASPRSSPRGIRERDPDAHPDQLRRPRRLAAAGLHAHGPGGARRRAAPLLESMHADAAMARAALAVGFEHPERLSDETLRGFHRAAARLGRTRRATSSASSPPWTADRRSRSSPSSAASKRRRCRLGDGRRLLRRRVGALALRDDPRRPRLVELPEAKLFFPYERAERLAAELRRHWEGAQRSA